MNEIATQLLRGTLHALILGTLRGGPLHGYAIVTAIARDLPGAHVAVPEGGYYVWLTLPEAVDGDLLAEQGAAAGVHLIAGSRFFAVRDEHTPRNHIRLSFSYTTPAQIDDGVQRLGAVYRKMTAQ